VRSGRFVDRHAAPVVLDAAHRGLAHVQPLGDERLRQARTVKGVTAVGAYDPSEISAGQRIRHDLRLPELGWYAKLQMRSAR
jgi:hypothetical protein